MQFTSTPCISVCQIEPVTGFCIGCGRTGREIEDWVSMTEAQRLALMSRLPERFVEIPDLDAARRAYHERIAARGRVGRRRRP
jgi:predicted Fe-S protein YdhL (DUF1289 family)